MNRRTCLRDFVCGVVVLLGTTIWGAPATRPATGPASHEANAPENPPPAERKFLSADEIQKIRRGELQPGDTARVQIPSEIRRAYAAKAGVSFAEFTAKPPVQQALDILSNGDVLMQAQVKVVSDPMSIIEYKRVQQTIVNGCAAIGCHNMTGAGAKFFMLYPGETDPVTYTNFYKLMEFRKGLRESGAFGGLVEHRLIERGRGDKSLLVQFGLPPGKADYPHPRVANYSGVFREAADPRLHRIIDWMDRSLSRIEPDYQIEPKQPATAPASQPATNPHPATR